jgi:hypothetical protein
MCGDCLYEISRENPDCVVSTTVRGLNDGMLRSASAPGGTRRGEVGRDTRRSNDNSKLRVVCVMDSVCV